MDISADISEPGMPISESNAPPSQVEVRQYVPQRKRLHSPKTFEDRAALGVRELRVPATWEQYLELADTCDYRVHYREGQIISFLEIEEKTGTVMGEATIPHEKLVMRFGTQLSILLDDLKSEYNVLGSNTKIFIGENRRGYNADVTVVKGEPVLQEYQVYKRKSKGLINPWLIVEVLSNSTRDFDLSEKLNDYKQIPGLQQIIFAEQGKLWVSTYIRVSEKEWQNLDFDTITDIIPIAEGAGKLSLAKIFARIF
ncbi:MAG: Uma2 family endonuclease [Saprospiraceae bacterium]|nr:Uma2 family endonuclease [Saprospiraceae bacterium]